MYSPSTEECLRNVDLTHCPRCDGPLNKSSKSVTTQRDCKACNLGVMGNCQCTYTSVDEYTITCPACIEERKTNEPNFYKKEKKRIINRIKKYNKMSDDDGCINCNRCEEKLILVNWYFLIKLQYKDETEIYYCPNCARTNKIDKIKETIYSRYLVSDDKKWIMCSYCKNERTKNVNSLIHTFLQREGFYMTDDYKCKNCKEIILKKRRDLSKQKSYEHNMKTPYKKLLMCNKENIIKLAKKKGVSGYSKYIYNKNILVEQLKDLITANDFKIWEDDTYYLNIDIQSYLVSDILTNRDKLLQMSLKDLQLLARENNLKNYSKYKKNELISMIENIYKIDF